MITVTDERISGDRRFLVDVHATIDDLLKQEDTSHDTKITVDDRGPKVILRFSMNGSFSL